MDGGPNPHCILKAAEVNMRLQRSELTNATDKFFLYVVMDSVSCLSCSGGIDAQRGNFLLKMLNLWGKTYIPFSSSCLQNTFLQKMRTVDPVPHLFTEIALGGDPHGPVWTEEIITVTRNAFNFSTGKAP